MPRSIGTEGPCREAGGQADRHFRILSIIWCLPATRRWRPFSAVLPQIPGKAVSVCFGMACSRGNHAVPMGMDLLFLHLQEMGSAGLRLPMGKGSLSDSQGKGALSRYRFTTGTDEIPFTPRGTGGAGFGYRSPHVVGIPVTTIWLAPGRHHHAERPATEDGHRQRFAPLSKFHFEKSIIFHFIAED